VSRIKRDTPTVVRGIRATDSFWDKCDEIAKKEGLNRNQLVVNVIEKYCNIVSQGGVIVGNDLNGKAVAIYIDYLGD
jgi:predicted DNA-binding ribbon-helix-helix protein